MDSFFKTQILGQYPREIIIVDNNSSEPIRIPEQFKNKGLDIILLTCKRLGPAAARNTGAKEANGLWLLFIDSDCVPTCTTIYGYLEAQSTEIIGYQGKINALDDDYVSQYYITQKIHRPPNKPSAQKKEFPKYLVSANILILKEAFDIIGGFNEDFLFGGEDIDLGLRLSAIGNIGYADQAIVLHDFNDGITGFIRRFIEYGKGNRQVETLHNIHLIPLPFTAKRKSVLVNHFLAILQWVCLLTGYLYMSINIKRKS